jgi:3-hydroxymyristoyl/3-hydroxydecanoyl-(acyl carrier protein) dehydratase
MRLLPEVLGERTGGGRVELDLRVPEDLACFTGHFPGLPILPGVVQLDWSVKLARERLGLAGEFAAAENLKFLSIVRPGAHLTLALELVDAAHLRFGYSSRGRKYSSGTLVFAAA